MSAVHSMPEVTSLQPTPGYRVAPISTQLYSLLPNPRHPPVGDLQSSWWRARRVHHLTRRDGHNGTYRQNGCGAPAHDQKTMVALLLCAYCLGVRSSRRIERAWQVDVTFGVVAANQAPDHTTDVNGGQGRAKEKKVNTTDPESTIMSSSKGFLQGYNARALPTKTR